MKTGSVTAILVLCLLRAASATTLGVTEIRFKSITGYSHDQFTLKIRSDGIVEYLGQNFVDVKGRRTSRIAQADFDKLVRKIEQIRFFRLEDRYDRYPVHNAPKVNGNEAVAESTIVTDQPTQIITVVARHRTKTVEDYMGPPKGLRELEELILDVTHASRWVGPSDDLHDIPYYESFSLNRRVTVRALLEHYWTGAFEHISGYSLIFMKDNGVIFNLEAPRNINLSKFDGYIVDATGYIKQNSKMDHVFVANDIRPVRRHIGVQPARKR